ncbi:ABC transporter substrate-binding protein [Frankia sp. CcWB2]
MRDRLYPDSGVLAPFSAARAGLDARIGLANERGGVHGRKIVYDWRDDQGTAEANAIGVRELVEERKVFGLLEFTLAASGSASYLAEQNIPVAGVAAEEVWSKYRNMFSSFYITGSAIDTYGRLVQSRGGTRAVLLRTALSAGIADTGSKIVQSVQSVGIPVVDEVSYTANADSPAAIAQRIVAARADTLLTVVDAHELPAVLNAIRAAGGNPTVILAASGYDGRLLRDAGAAVAGVTVPVFHRPFEAGGPPITSYIDAMRRYAPQREDPEQEITMMAYINTDLFLRGLEEAGDCPTRQGFVDGLRSVTNYDAGGLIQPIDLRNSLGRQSTCLAFVQVNNAGTAFGVVAENLCGKEITAGRAAS